MKSLIASLAGLAVLATAGAAVAAPPEYCALYAREYANQFSAAVGEKPGSEQSIQDEAYYRCLNMDQEPEMPPSSAYYGTSIDATGQGGPLEPIAGDAGTTGGDPPPAPAKQGAAAAAGNDGAPSDRPVPPKPVTKTANSAPSGRSYTGGLEPWTDQWRATCRKYFPNSFNEKDGTILPHGSTKRVFCR